MRRTAGTEGGIIMEKQQKICLTMIIIITAIVFMVSKGTVWYAEADAASPSPSVQKIKDVIVIVGDHTIDFEDAVPVSTQGRILVPLRAIFEAMGATVDWESESRTIFASRKDRSIELSINEGTAFVNKKQVVLDVPAMIVGNRTMVPLRFVGEAFDGIVDWNSQTKTVAISLAKENMQEVPDLQVELNNKILSFETPPITKDGRNYLPPETILAALDGEVYWEQKDDEVSITMDGVSIIFSTGKNYAMINGQRVYTTDFPIEYQENILVPIRFVTEAFGGIAHFVQETKMTHIYINRPKFKTSFLEKEERKMVTPVPVPRPSLIDNRMLMVSDNPEILTSETIPAENVTLWHHPVVSSQNSQDHRVFGWHINRLGKKLKLGITIENLSEQNVIEIVGLQGIKRNSPNGWSNYDVGIPLVETMLGGQLLNIKVETPRVQPGETIVLHSFEVESDHLVGFLDEFTVKNVQGTGEMKYTIRTVLSQQEDSDLAAIKSFPVALDRKNPHPRGNWSGSTLLTKLSPYQADSGAVAYSISNGITDNLLTPENALNDHGSVIANSGHYGVTYKIKIPVINNTGKEKIVRVSFGGRGGLYAGAVKTNEGVFITPVLEPMKEVANVLDYEIQEGQGVIELEVMHAGGSALALGLEISTLN